MKYMMITIVVGLMSGFASQAVAKPLKVFILAGQSNMQGWTSVDTFDYLATDPKTAPNCAAQTVRGRATARCSSPPAGPARRSARTCVPRRAPITSFMQPSRLLSALLIWLPACGLAAANPNLLYIHAMVFSFSADS